MILVRLFPLRAVGVREKASQHFGQVGIIHLGDINFMMFE